MEELYWITRCDAIHAFCCLLAGISGMITVVMLAVYLDCECPHYFRKAIIVSSIALLVGISGAIFVPTTKDACIIYGVGGTIDYIKQDTIAQKLPQKAIIALDKYLESINDNYSISYKL